jgi:hypothetical protein
MRAAPIGVFAVSTDGTIGLARQQCRLTHNHPFAIAGSVTKCSDREDWSHFPGTALGDPGEESGVTAAGIQEAVPQCPGAFKACTRWSVPFTFSSTNSGRRGRREE